MIDLPEPSAGRLDGRVHHYAVRAYFEDTDLSGMVYHANCLRWFERARTELLRLLGIEQRGVMEAGEGVYAVAEIPRTLSGKVLEVPVKRILMGDPVDRAASRDSLANPESLDYFVDLAGSI